MRIVNTNLALQGSSFSATVVNSYHSQEIINRKMVDLSAPRAQERVITRIRGDDYEGSENPIPEGEEKKNVIIEQAQPQMVHKSNSLGGYDTLMSRDRIRMLVLEQLLGRLTGNSHKFRQSEATPTGYDSSGHGIFGGNRARANTVRTTFSTETVQESGFSFAAKGTVETEDGQSISLELNFSFSQSFVSKATIVSEVEQKLVDPLVINFSGEMPKFEDDTMSFDLDVDGILDNIKMLKPGSGFLALDKNENGEIDDGSELFGPTLGNGFAELSKYDEDGNGWIDEADAIFGKLKVWCADSRGEKQLVALKEKGVGAIFLGSVNTEMNIYDSGERAGKLQKSGLVLMENGQGRMMQEIDLRI